MLYIVVLYLIFKPGYEIGYEIGYELVLFMFQI